MIPIPIGTSPPSDAVARLLSELQHATAITDERRRGHWIDVCSNQWRTLLGGRYRQVIAEAERLGFIEINNRYAVGRFCKSFRLAGKYRTPETSQYRLKRHQSSLDGRRVRLDHDDATGLKLEACFDAVEIPEHADVDGWDSFCVRSIRSGSWYAVRCPYRRFHSSFTALPKMVRATLRINNNQRVAEVDVSNCQPLILGLLATHQTHTTDTTHTPSLHMLHKLPLSGGVRKYLELCGEGRIYEYLQDRFDGNNPPSRETVKRQFLVLMFANNAITKRVPLFRVVANEFPAIATFIIDAKREQYQNLARDCQRFESALMIDQVAARLVDRFPIVTVHDSIVAPMSRSAEVANEIRTQFEAMGVTVSVRVDAATP